MLLLKIFELIKRLEKDIGNDCIVGFYASQEDIVIHILWRKDDLTLSHIFNLKGLEFVFEELVPINTFVDFCKKQYLVKMKEKENKTIKRKVIKVNRPKAYLRS